MISYNIWCDIYDTHTYTHFIFGPTGKLMPQRRSLQVGQHVYSTGKNVPCLLTLILCSSLLVSPQCSSGLSHLDMNLKAVPPSFPHLPLKPHLAEEGVRETHAGTAIRLIPHTRVPLNTLASRTMPTLPAEMQWVPRLVGTALAPWLPLGISKNPEPGDLLDSPLPPQWLWGSNYGLVGLLCRLQLFYGSTIPKSGMFGSPTDHTLQQGSYHIESHLLLSILLTLAPVFQFVPTVGGN